MIHLFLLLFCSKDFFKWYTYRLFADDHRSYVIPFTISFYFIIVRMQLQPIVSILILVQFLCLYFSLLTHFSLMLLFFSFSLIHNFFANNSLLCVLLYIVLWHGARVRLSNAAFLFSRSFSVFSVALNIVVSFFLTIYSK